MKEPQTKQEFDLDSRYNGQYSKTCDICHRHILPRGRSAPMEMLGCEHERGGDLWFGETREQFGYPSELAAESLRLRDQFYPPTLDDEQIEELQEDYDEGPVRIAVIELIRLRGQVTALKAQVAAWHRHDNNWQTPPFTEIGDD